MPCTVSRNWLLGGYEATFTLQPPVADKRISPLAHSLLCALHDICSDLTSAYDLPNIKGREVEQVLLTGTPVPLSGEIFTIGGTVATAGDSSGFVWTPFRFSILTNFKRFEGSSDIVFSLQQSRNDAIPSWFPWWLLGAAAPIKVEYLRLGLEAFTTRFSISRFGSIPAVSDSLLIDLAHDTLAVRLTTDQPRRRRCNPFESIPAFKRVSGAVDSVLGISLSTQFAEELESAGAIPR